MKKTNAFFCAVTAIAMCAVSCTKEEQKGNGNYGEVSKLSPMEFTTENPDTRTYLEGKSVKWSPEDKIGIFDGSGNRTFTVDAEQKGIFTGEAAEAETYYAIYPYNSDATFADGKITYKKSWSSHWCAPNNFPKESAVLAAKADGNNLQFKHLCAYFKITIPENSDVWQVVVFSAGNRPISGTFELTFEADGTPVINPLSISGEQFGQAGISAPNNSDGKNFEPGDYYIPVLPVELSSGFNLKITHRDESVTRVHTGKSVKLTAGKIINLGTVKKTDAFTFDNFESGELSKTRFQRGNDGIYSGDNIGVIPNPQKGNGNDSEYVLDDNMSGSNTSTSGFFNITFPSTEFSNAVKSHYNVIRMKVWLGDNDYYPMLCWRDKSATKKLPSTVNGQTVTNADEFKAAVFTDKWNVFEWNTKTCWGYDSFSGSEKAQMRPFQDKSGNNTGKDETHTRTVLFDDIEFINYK